KVFENGKCVYKNPSLKEISQYRKKALDEFWDEYKRLTNPHIYKVDLSDGLYDLKHRMLLGNGDTQ
ncbi:MAG: nicotinate phosphoribosyltransferase, partial [Clostridia bacterium]|nr:nicotinate phosphoribosyltransferase [Clostridia bacterium]